MRRFVLAGLALTVFSACQPATTELTDNQKAEIAAEVELLHGQMWDAWRETNISRGMSYFRNSPELTFAYEGELTFGFSAWEVEVESGFGTVASQRVTFSKSQTTVLAQDVVCIMEQGTGAETDTSGVTTPESPFAFTTIWVRQDGEWKIHFAHSSSPTPETP